jgi:hypothetical protein
MPQAETPGERKTTVSPPRRQLVADDVGPLAPLVEVFDRRCQRILVREERDGGVAAVVPGGVLLVDRDDQHDIPILWRYAYWASGRDLVYDLPPAFVMDTTLVDVLRRHPEQGEWLLARSAEQLEAVGHFLLRDKDFDLRAKDVARRRALFVYLEIDAARGLAKELGQEPPQELSDALDRVRDVTERPAINAMALLNTYDGQVELKMRKFGQRRRRRTGWHGLSARLLMVFIKLFEAQRALEELGSAEDIAARLRLLRGALQLANYRADTTRALDPLATICNEYIALLSKGKIDDDLRAMILIHLDEQAQELADGLHLPSSGETTRRPVMLGPEFGIAA